LRLSTFIKEFYDDDDDNPPDLGLVSSVATCLVLWNLEWGVGQAGYPAEKESEVMFTSQTK